MGIFDKIKDAIFGHDEAKATPASVPTPGTARLDPATTEPVVASTTPAYKPEASAAPTPAATSPASAAPAAGHVDVAAILDKAAASSGQKLDWRHSIVDLMKALGMDASLAERKELAQELHYTGDTGDSGKMNVFLHKALLQKLAENGGRIPADLMD